MSKTWMLTHTRAKVFPLDYKAEDTDVRNIARSLAFQCRYNGHVDRFYSVAEHSDIIRRAMKRDGLPLITQKCGFLHDAAEHITGDVIRPLKNALTEKGVSLKPYELAIEEKISERYGLPWPWPIEVEQYDTRILRDEKDQLKADPSDDWSSFGVPSVGLGIHIEGWGPYEAEQRFLASFFELFPEERR
jgi:hypothetical protein